MNKVDSMTATTHDCVSSPDGAGRHRLAARDVALTTIADADAPLALRAWRGRSGRRYVVSVYPLAPDADDAYASALLIAARRGADGGRELIGACESSAIAISGINGAWIARMRQLGANELHIHLLAATREARAATLRDLEPTRGNMV